MDDDCSICLNPLTDPKFLPCSHSFCKNCLQIYIDRNANDKPIKCPLCQQEAKPEDPERPKTEWAELFPSNRDVPEKPEDLELEHQETDDPEPDDPEPDDQEPDDQEPDDQEPDDQELEEQPITPVTPGAEIQVEPQQLKLKQDITLRFTEGKDLFAGINDMVLLEDQSFIITEAYYKKVWIFSNTGEVLQDLLLDKEPFGLSLLHSSLLAVSLPFDKKILILNYENLAIKDTLSFEKSYFGLGSDDMNRIYALYHDENIFVDVISRNDCQSSYEISHVIKLPFFFCGIYRLRVLPSGHVLIISYNKKIWKLCCVDQNGDEFFFYEGEEDNKFKPTSDVAVGSNFIYVADKTTKTLHRIKHQGDLVDTPLTAHEVSYEPSYIYVSRKDEIAMFHKGKHDCRIQIFSS